MLDIYTRGQARYLHTGTLLLTTLPSLVHSQSRWYSCLLVTGGKFCIFNFD